MSNILETTPEPSFMQRSQPTVRGFITRNGLIIIFLLLMCSAVIGAGMIKSYQADSSSFESEIKEQKQTQEVDSIILNLLQQHVAKNHTVRPLPPKP